MNSHQNIRSNHIPYRKKQLSEATATVFLQGWKSKAVDFLIQSIFTKGADFPTTTFDNVAFLQFSQNCILVLSWSIKWKLLLYVPVAIVLPSGEQLTLNLSNIAQFSNTSLSLPFILSLRRKVLTGFFELHTSQTFTDRKSRVTRYFPCLQKSTEEKLVKKSVRKFFCPGYQFLKLVAVVSELEEIRRSHSFRLPLFVPKMKRLSLVGCILLKLIFYWTSSIFVLPIRSATTQGLSYFQQFHK